MSQNANQNQSRRTPPIAEREKKAEPITEVSPDDPIGVEADGTGKPGAPEK